MNKKYIMVLDTETANTHVDENGKLDMSDSLIYDIGWQIVDLYGNIYDKKSYVVAEIFNNGDLMKSAYYSKKIPKYIEDIKNKKRKVATFNTIKFDLFETLKKYKSNIVCMHNARFDDNALKITQRYITKSKYRYFLPFNCEIWDTLKMSNDVIVPMKSYQEFCKDNGYMTKHKKPRPKATAEVLYRFISKNNDFVESHTGFEDVEIESQILFYCLRKHKKMRRKLYEN